MAAGAGRGPLPRRLPEYGHPPPAPAAIPGPDLPGNASANPPPVYLTGLRGDSNFDRIYPNLAYVVGDCLTIRQHAFNVQRNRVPRHFDRLVGRLANCDAAMERRNDHTKVF